MERTYEDLRDIMDENPHLFDGLTPSKAEFFRKWLPNNMHIYKLFVKYATELKVYGHREYYSARAIWHRLRWESMVSDKPEAHLKISDHNSPYVARLVMVAEPQLKNMFRRKSQVVI